MKKVDSAIRYLKSTDKTNWNTHVSHPLQSWAWGEFRHSMGIDATRFISSNNDRCQVLFHPVPYTSYTIGYFPKGPALTKSLVEELKKIGKQKRAIFIQ